MKVVHERRRRLWTWGICWALLASLAVLLTNWKWRAHWSLMARLAAHDHNSLNHVLAWANHRAFAMVWSLMHTITSAHLLDDQRTPTVCQSSQVPIQLWYSQLSHQITMLPTSQTTMSNHSWIAFIQQIFINSFPLFTVVLIHSCKCICLLSALGELEISRWWRWQQHDDYTWCKQKISIKSENNTNRLMNWSDLLHAALNARFNVAATKWSDFTQLLWNLNAVAQQLSQVIMISLASAICHQLKHIYNNKQLQPYSTFYHNDNEIRERDSHRVHLAL